MFYYREHELIKPFTYNLNTYIRDRHLTERKKLRRRLDGIETKGWKGQGKELLGTGRYPAGEIVHEGNCTEPASHAAAIDLSHLLPV